jgi:hypothetical protein
MVESGHDRLDAGPIRLGIECFSPRTAIEELAQDLVLLLEQCQRLLDRSTDLLTGPVSLGVIGKRGPQGLSDADVVDN